MLKPFTDRELEVFDSPASHYRMRAEFRVWHEGDDLYHIMFNQADKQKYRVDEFAPANMVINTMMHELIKRVKESKVLRGKLFQIDYLSGLCGEVVISLLYHKSLTDEWQQHATELRESLCQVAPTSIIGRARKQKLIIGDDFITEALPLSDRTYLFKHIENSFTQPNATVNCKMIEWTRQVCTSNKDTDLLELYCGAGNFSLPLSTHFRKVIGTEIAKPSVQAAQDNIALNQIANVDIVRLSAEEFMQALRAEREFSRLQGIDLTSYNFSTVLVDPPRAGLDEDSLKTIQHYNEIIYISCNPQTLVDNLATLTQTHRITDCALFDQFPFTHHMEAGVKLVRN